MSREQIINLIAANTLTTLSNIIRLRYCHTSPGGLEQPTFRLTAERANQLRHGDTFSISVYLNFVSNYFEMNG